MRTLPVVAVLLFSTTLHAGDSFTLWNTHYRTVTFQFFRTEAESGWLDNPSTIISQDGKPIYLESIMPHSVFVHDDQGVTEWLENVNFHGLLQNSSDKRVELQQLYSTETRTRTQTVTRTRQETRQRTVMIYRSVPVTKTRIETYRDSGTGQLRQREVQYTEMQQVPEEQTMNYTVNVPEQVQVQENYTVRVPRLKLSVNQNGRRVELDFKGRFGDGLPQDRRFRRLGIRFHDTPEGPVVTRVEPGSPATRLIRLGANDGRFYRFMPGRAVITQVNGQPVTNSNELLAAIQASPPIAVFRVADRGQPVSNLFQAKLEMR